MGREIRRVPPNWQHPMQKCEHSPWNGGCSTAKENEGRCYKPLFEGPYQKEAEDWIRGLYEWERRWREEADEMKSDGRPRYFWEWEGPPPDPENYADYKGQDPTWYQMYETVSKGTPVTPPFETKEELVAYLVEEGTFWGQKYTKEVAERFVEAGWAPSFVFDGGEVLSGVEYIGR